MMRRNAVILGLALLGVLAPPLAAQQWERAAGPGRLMFGERRAWLGFSYEQTETRRPGERTLTLTVVSVVKGSPAERAGLQEKDQILRINNLGGSEQLLGSLGSSLNPGDTVTLRIRRGSNERDLRIIAAEPPNDFEGFGVTVTVDGDSVRRLVRVFTDSMRAGMDTTVFRYLLRGDSAFRFEAFRDSLLTGLDSMRVHAFGNGVLMGPRFRFRADSAGEHFRVEADSMFFRRSGGPDDVFRFSFPGGEELMVAPFMAGFRAVGGAELHELSAELATYFDVEDGVLVMSAPNGSPARRAGLQAGDVITAANDAEVTTIPQLRQRIERASGRAVQLEVMRHGRKLTVELPK